jgi:hypothetical protein
MKANLFVWLFFLGNILQLNAQNRCGSSEYLQRSLQKNPSLQSYQQHIEKFIQSRLLTHSVISANARPASPVTIKIPVVVHIVYHLTEENIPDEAINNQVRALNRDYRRMNADTSNTPGCFKSVAADCNIEFELAKVDPNGRTTTGIERVYSPVAKWIGDDKMKYKKSYGANGWDADSYLNIWVCSMNDLLGYASIMGEAKELDGVVVNYTVFNDFNDGGAYNSGRTAVHEIGHWLGLKHIWGDADCGDDGVGDTPRQSTYTSGCPGGTRSSCGNAPHGDMYMNFMDYTNDPCMNLFTKGQSDRMRALFDDKGFRSSILNSKALGEPYSQAILLPDSIPAVKRIQVYPNPVKNELILDIKEQEKWIGKEIVITNFSGQVLFHYTITAKKSKINTSGLSQGIYFIQGNDNNDKLSLKFIKL